MTKNYGQPIRHDPDFSGPTHNRSCTDILWLILFILFLGVWGFVGYYSITHGDINKILSPIDSKGRRCGIDSGLTDKPFLMFFNIAKCLSPDTPIVGCATPQVCVQQCPSRTIFFDLEMTEANFAQMKSKMVCTDEVNIDNLNYQDAKNYMNAGKCANFVLNSQPVLSRCIGDLSSLSCKRDSKPTNLKPVPRGQTECVKDPEQMQRSLLNRATALDTYIGWIAASWVTFFTNNERETHILSAQIVQDLVYSRWYMLGALVAVVVLCFIYILLLRWVITPVVWGSIAGLLGVLGFSVYLCYKNYVYFRENPNSLHQTTNVKGYVQSLFSKSETWMGIMIAVAIVVVILLLLVIFLRNRISIAIALIQEGSKAITAVKVTILFPIFPWILHCAAIAYAVLVLIYILSMGESVFYTVNLNEDTNCQCLNSIYTNNNESCDPASFTLYCHNNGVVGESCALASCHFSGLDSPYSVVYLHLANLLGFFWTSFFISGVADMMLASTFSTWYWTFHKRDLPFFTLTAGICRTLRYHLGTVAFGSLIIAIVRVIRVILEYIDKKLKKFDNALTRALMCCCKCFFWCLENFLKFINKNAYIMCAVHGKNFCTSARDAFSLLMRNIVRVVVLDKVTDFIFFLSKLLMSIGVGFAVYYLLQWNLVYEVTQGQQLHNNYVPAVILSIATYLICSIFFNVYSMAVDTLFLCFLEDCERNDGSIEKPYFMSRNLMKILGKTNKKE